MKRLASAAAPRAVRSLARLFMGPMLALPLLPFGAIACSAAPSTDAAHDEGERTAASAEALSAPELAYFFLDRDPGDDGFVARAVNHSEAPCGRGRAERCVVDDVDLSALDLSAKDGRNLLAAVRDRSLPNSMVFLGSVESTRGGHRNLRVVDAWRAPHATHWSGTLYRVSRDELSCDGGECCAARALRLGEWRVSYLRELVLDGAPAFGSCRFVPGRGDGCKSPYDAAEAAEASESGLLVAGHRDPAGALVAEQYFLRVGVGGVCDDGGFNYCSSAQSCVPESGQCGEPCDGPCTRGRGRGVMPTKPPTAVEEWLSRILRTAPVEPRTCTL